MPTIHEAPQISRKYPDRHLNIPRFSYPAEIIPAGRAAHIGGGIWLKRCAAPWCNLAWTRQGGFNAYEHEHTAHEITHNIPVAGRNVGLLP